MVTDSISKLIDGDREINPIIWNCLFGEDIWMKFKSASPSQTNALIQSIKFRAQLLNREAIGYFYKKSLGISCFDMWSPIFPFVLSYESAPKVGETYHAQISLSKRFRNSTNISIWVDGKSLQNGVFSEHCSEAGEKIHNIEFEIKNPATGEREYFGREKFSYTVIDNCR